MRAQARGGAAVPGTSILMDVQMPVMDGLTATRAIRALGGRAATIPIVALTANAFAAEMQECRDAGMDDHIAKPSGFAQLKRAVDRWNGAASSPPPPSGSRAGAKPSLAERFAARRRTAAERLAALLGEPDSGGGLGLLREAAETAHVFAGTAAMFGEARLGKVARQAEEEIRLLMRDRAAGTDAKAKASIERFVAALGASQGRSDLPAPLTA